MRSGLRRTFVPGRDQQRFKRRVRSVLRTRKKKGGRVARAFMDRVGHAGDCARGRGMTDIESADCYRALGAAPGRSDCGCRQQDHETQADQEHEGKQFHGIKHSSIFPVVNRKSRLSPFELSPKTIFYCRDCAEASITSILHLKIMQTVCHHDHGALHRLKIYGTFTTINFLLTLQCTGGYSKYNIRKLLDRTGPQVWHATCSFSSNRLIPE